MNDKQFNQELNKTDGFFSTLANTKPYLKINFFGFAGSGKTYTSALTAIGLHQRLKSTKPICIFDTEMAAKFLKPLFESHNIPVLVKESRSLADLKETMRRCREGLADILLIDSLSHVWENFLQSYQQKKNRTFLQFQDWGVIKPTWKQEFSDPFVRDPYHIIMTGRAGYEYANEINEETGKREIYKSGVKEKVEGETAYEPDLIVLMERMQEMEGGEVKRVLRRGVVIKDRSTLLDGKTFENPAYEHLAPVVEAILTDPAKRDMTMELDAAALIKTEDDKREYLKRRDIALEKIEAYLVSVWPGASAENKQLKVSALEFAFNTPSWTEISGKSPNDLEAGLLMLHEFVENIIASRAAAKNIEEKKLIEEESPARKAMKKGMAAAGVK